MGGAMEFLVSVSIALTADLPSSMFVPSFISGSPHSWSLNLCICERWVKVLVPIPGWLLFSLALAWTRLIRAFNGASRNFTEPGVEPFPCWNPLQVCQQLRIYYLKHYAKQASKHGKYIEVKLGCSSAKIRQSAALKISKDPSGRLLQALRNEVP